MNLNILADANIPRMNEACATLGHVRVFSDTDELHRELAAGADVLLCRSTVRVDEALLSGSGVRFVGTATSGTEHVDETWLSRNGIRFASAAGSNALSVAEYVFTVLYILGCRQGFDPAAMSIGVIGVGHVGTWVAHLAERIGMRVIQCDPPRQAAEVGGGFRSLEEALEADIVTLHVPLNESGAYPTLHMIGTAAFARMRRGVVFINTSRGGVTDAAALLEAHAAGRLRALVLDVYHGEPAVDPRLVRIADIATPHIAGHSLDGKMLGTQMIYESLCRFIGVEPVWNYLHALPPAHAIPHHPDRGGAVQCEIADALTGAFDAGADDRALRRISSLAPEAARRAFASYRASYRERREFHACFIDMLGYSRHAARVLSVLAQRG